MPDKRHSPKRVSRRDFIKGAGASVVALTATRNILAGLAARTAETESATKSSVYPQTTPQSGPYNIVFITTDQERYFRQFPQGTEFKTRERLQQMGTSFEKHYTCANMCTSSRSVIYTGQHIPQTGMFDNTGLPWQPNMSQDIPTIGDMLRKAGYYTAYKGKVHLSTDLEPGDSGELKTNAMEPYGFSDYNAQGDDFGHEHGGYDHDIGFAADAVKWLRTQGAELSKKNKPWFLAVNFINPHDIMYFNTDRPGVSEQDNDQVSFDILRKPDNTKYDRTYHNALPDNLFQPIEDPGRPRAHYEYTRGWDVLCGKIPSHQDNWRRYRDYYYNCLQNVDNQIDMVLDALANMDMLKNTIIVFTADHGEMAGNHGLRGKGPFSYEENIHLPLIIAHPAHAGGRKCRAITSHLDLTPTLVALTGIDPDKARQISGDIPGHDLTPLLTEPEKAPANAIRPGALFCFNMFMTIDSDFIIKMTSMQNAGKSQADIKKSGLKPDFSKRGSMRTFCDGRYKFTRYFSPLQHNQPRNLEELTKYNDVELFDLKNDPAEMHNLGQDMEKNKDLILAMNAKLNKLITAEIGKDTGQKLPKMSNVSWAVTPAAMRH